MALKRVPAPLSCSAVPCTTRLAGNFVVVGAARTGDANPAEPAAIAAAPRASQVRLEH
jgi:hypothetical protein